MSNKLVSLRSASVAAADDRPATLSEVRALISELAGVLRADIAKINAAPPDQFVEIPQAAPMLGMSISWLRHNWEMLPFAKKVGGRVRFSVNGINRWKSGT